MLGLQECFEQESENDLIIMQHQLENDDAQTMIIPWGKKPILFNQVLDS